MQSTPPVIQLPTVVRYTQYMGWTRKVASIPDTVSDTGEKISAGIDTATLYLVVVGTVAITALIVAAVALGKTRA